MSLTKSEPPSHSTLQEPFNGEQNGRPGLRAVDSTLLALLKSQHHHARGLMRRAFEYEMGGE